MTSPTLPQIVENPWQPIETAPKDGTSVLIAGGLVEHSESMGGPSDFRGVTIAQWVSLYGYWMGQSAAEYDAFYAHYPTHWMPLPTPPEQVRTHLLSLGEGM